jgi:hypothetical protein
MGTPRTIGAVSSTNQAITPVLTGVIANGPQAGASSLSAVSFSITNNIATIVVGAGNLPTTGYNGPNGFPIQNATTGSKLDLYPVGSLGSGGAPNGQQVTLWGFTTATYFNGKTVTVLDNDGSSQFRFYFTHANVGSTGDAGKTAPIPVESYRAVRLEWSATGADTVYVGDLNVSSSRYIAALSSAGQLSVEISGDNIRADRIFIVGSNAAGTDTVQCSVIY